MNSKSFLTGFLSKILGLLINILRTLQPLLFALQTRFGIIKGLRLDFVPRPDDIFIASYPRSGTTWMQMIVYQISTDGNMDFAHITEHSPFFERGLAFDRDYEKMPAPRVFKTHMLYRQLPKGPKYIYIARAGKDVAVSYYKFYQSHLGYRDSFEEFFDQFVKGAVMNGSWFRHVNDWWQHRDDPNVLFITYEDLAQDLEGNIRRIIDFCGLRVDPARMPQILEACSFQFMKKHQTKFDHMVEAMMDEGYMPEQFIRSGNVGSWKDELTPEQQRQFAEEFARQFGASDLPEALRPEPLPERAGKLEDAA